MFVMIALLADGIEPREKAGAGLLYLVLEFRIRNRRGEVCRHLGPERMLLKIGALPVGAIFHYHVLLLRRDKCHVIIASPCRMRAVGQVADRTCVRDG
jgi:hypothetical protein